VGKNPTRKIGGALVVYHKDLSLLGNATRWYQLEVSEIGGGLPSTWLFEPVFGWRGRSVLRDYRHGLFFGTACCKLNIIEVMVCSWHSWIYSTPLWRTPTFSWPLVSLRPARNVSLGKWLLVACFASVRNHNVSGPHLFQSVTTHAQKSPCLPRTVLHRAKKSLCNRSQFRTLFLPHRFIKIRPSHRDPSALNFSQFVGFQDSPSLSKIEKVAETCEFDGKEPLLVERTIAISISAEESI